jgi:DNA-binding NarL/FixJ family response regulator
MLSTYTEPAIVNAARNAGAFAFLSKDANVDEVVATIEAGMRGGTTLIGEQPVPVLTPRETLVLGQLLKGATNKEIAVALGIGVDTVKDHLERLYGKLDAGDRLQAVRHAQLLGLDLIPYAGS